MWHYEVMKRTYKYFVTKNDIQNECDATTYEIYEYYPDSNNWTENSIKPSGDTKEELIRDLERMLKDANKYKTRDYDTGEEIDDVY